MSGRLRVRTFYESFVNTVYGFVLVLGFQRFVTLAQPKIEVTFVLLVAAYITVLHYWLVFVASTEDTFALILASSGDTARMGWFWTELVFATAMIVPMLKLFDALTNALAFAKVMLAIALLSFGWDVWALALGRRRVVVGNLPSEAAPPKSAAVFLIQWIGLDSLFVVMMLLVIGVLSQPGANQILAVWSLAAISGVGAILDTLVIAPSLFLGSDAESAPLARSPVLTPPP
jgi:hypothetical protein